MEQEVFDVYAAMGKPNEPLPEWAVDFAHGKLVLGAQLCTRDGRRMGNAHIVAIPEREFVRNEVYLILTDAGNSVAMLESEIKDAFYPPKYVSNVGEVIKKFWRENIPLTYK